MIVSFFTDNLVIQISAFLISSIILIFTTRKFVNLFLKHDKTNYVNSVNSYVGSTVKVTVDIVPLDNKGQVKIGGETWTAISENGETIPKDTEVIITNFSGVKAVVKPK